MWSNFWMVFGTSYSFVLTDHSKTVVLEKFKEHLEFKVFKGVIISRKFYKIDQI